MILIDAVFINDGGGKVLLDYLINELEKSKKKVTYLLDERVKYRVQPIKTSNSLFFISNKFQLRRRFYLQNKSSFSVIFCFGNVPPYIKTSAIVYTYFHQLLFLESQSNFSLKDRVLIFLKQRVIDYFKQYSDYWCVQTSLVAEKLNRKFKLDTDKIKILPFYDPLRKTLSLKRKMHTYCYVANAYSYKNHFFLIEAFCVFYQKHKIGQLFLTVSNEFPEVIRQIQEKVFLGFPIMNLGVLEREKVARLYEESEYLVFPSSAESFGLPLVEAIEMGCKVIAPNLPYVHAVCDPSIVFDEISKESILSALIKSLENDIPDSTAKVENKMKDLLALLK